MNPDIQRFIEVLSHAELGGVTEVCVNPGGAWNQLVGYFESPSLATKAIADYDGQMSIYITLNPVKRDLLARVNNKLAKSKTRTADTDVLCDSWFFFDIDPKRPSGISSTDSELQEAILIGKKIVKYLLNLGVNQKAILTGISGNGAYVLVRLPDYEITREQIELKKRLLNFFADQFSTATIEIDRTVYNPSRLVAALGTLKMKGESITERPHRHSQIRSIAGVRFDPSLIQRCVPFNLYALADVLLPPETKRKSNLKASSNGQSLDVEQWMAKHSLDVANVKQWAGTGFSGRLYVLRACPFNSNHDKSAFIIQADNAALSFGCHHNSCANYGWRELRALYEPERLDVGRGSKDAGDVVYAPITEAEAGEGISWRVTEAGVVVSLDDNQPPAAALEKAKRVEAELKPRLKTVLSEAELKWVKERQEQEMAAHRQVKRFNPESLQARFHLERFSLLRELRKAYISMVLFYTKPEGGNNSLEDAIRLAGVKIKGTQEAKRLYKKIGKRSPDQISWHELNDLFLCDPEAAEYFWQDIKEAARKDVASGHYLARVFEHTEWMNSPWQRAEFQAIRDRFIAEWEPRGQIELCMIDAMAVAFYLFLYWTGEHNKRTKLDARSVSNDYKEWWDRSFKHWSRNGDTYKTKYSGQYYDGHWDLPYQKEAEAIQQAAELADRFRREFFAGVRQLRD